MSHILVVDDEPDMLRFVQRGLTADGHTVSVAGDGEEGLRLARQHRPSVVILDVKLSGTKDGAEVLAALAAWVDRPRVIMLSAMADVRTRVRLLEVGAADYLTKPFVMAELLARVHAQLRSIRHEEVSESIELGRMSLDVRHRCLHVGDRTVELTNREFLLLQHLMSKPGLVCSREELLAEVWGYSFDPGTNVVDACVRRLRSKMKTDDIDTVRNVGYTLRSA